MEHIPHDVENPTGRNSWSLLRPLSLHSRLDSLWHHRDFMRLWVAQTVSQLGSSLTGEALPYIAILTLHVSPFQMGLLGAAGSAPLLLLGLFAGVWVDRLRRRPIMIATDIGRAVLLLSIPLAFLWGLLRIEQLYIVAALMGIMTVFFDVAYQSFLPSLVQREQLVEGNSKLGISASLAEISGPPLGGALVQIIGGPVTVLFDACSFVWSAFTLRRIRTPEPVPVPTAEREHILRDMSIGVLEIAHDPLLRPLAIASVLRNFFGWFFGAVYTLYAIRVLGLSPAMVGFTVAFGGLGALCGAFLVGPVTRRLGVGPTIIGAMLVGSMVSTLMWLAGGMVNIAFLLLIIAQLLGDVTRAMGEINQVSLLQTIVPGRLLGRVNATIHVTERGIGTLGLLVGGLLAETIGLRSTVAVALFGGLLSGVWLLCSPIRRVRTLPVPHEE